MADTEYLLDLNVLIAITEEEHEHHLVAQHWFDGAGDLNWGTCALTQAGFIRMMANPKARGLSVKNAEKLLAILTAHPGHRIWPMNEGWTAMTAPFTERIFGHQQVTDAYLLALAVKGDGVLVTMDRGLGHLAGPQYKRNLLVLEP